MNTTISPATCPKCGGDMQEGLTTLNKEIFQYREGHPAIGKRLILGGSCSWYALTTPASPGTAEKVLTGQPHQVFAYRCERCGFLEFYAP